MNELFSPIEYLIITFLQIQCHYFDNFVLDNDLAEE